MTGPTCRTRRWRPVSQDWLAPQLDGMSRLADARAAGPGGDPAGAAAWPLVRRLDAALPAQLILPAGRAAIDYTAAGPGGFGASAGFLRRDGDAALAGGRVPLRLALLSPAGRPVAITGDLAGFWRGGWADVRRDMRGPYPKHDWPEDPGPKQSAAANSRRQVLVAAPRPRCHVLLKQSLRSSPILMTWPLLPTRRPRFAVLSWRY